MQGDLTDPSYFDFISFAQLATISREIPKGQQEFEVRSTPLLSCLAVEQCWQYCEPFVVLVNTATIMRID